MQKPSLHETADQESRLWRFGRVGQHCFEGRHERLGGRSARPTARRLFTGHVALSLGILFRSIGRGSRCAGRPGQSMIVTIGAAVWLDITASRDHETILAISRRACGRGRAGRLGRQERGFWRSLRISPGLVLGLHDQRLGNFVHLLAAGCGPTRKSRQILNRSAYCGEARTCRHAD